jgi:hypothetical protein
VGPAVVIRIPLESRPSVRVDAMSEGEVNRLEDWLRAHPELIRLIEAAIELREERTA